MLESHSVASKHALAGHGPSLPSLTMFVVVLSFVACSFSMADRHPKRVKLTDFFSSVATPLNTTPLAAVVVIVSVQLISTRKSYSSTAVELCTVH